MRMPQFSTVALLVLLLGVFATANGAPPVITVTNPNGGTLEIFDVETFTWTVLADTGIAYFEIWFSHDSSNWVMLDSISGSEIDFDWTVPLELDADCWISVFAEDSVGGQSFDNSSAFGIGPRTEEFDFPDGTALISLPLIPDDDADSIWQVVGDDLEHRYQVFGFEPNQGFFNADTMAHGKGYFILFDEFVPGDQTEFDVTGIPVIEDSAQIDLVWGWNVICTPFRSRVDLWDQATFWYNDTLPMTYWQAGDNLMIHPPVFSFTNWGHIIDDELDPWRAYWFLTLVPGMSVTVYPDPEGPHPAPGRDGGDEGTPNNWFVDISGTYGRFIDNARLGVTGEATDGFDNNYDYAEPPAPPTDEYISLHFNHERWNSPAGNRYERDIRSPLDRGETVEWMVTVSPSAEGQVTLTWANFAETSTWRNNYTLIDGDRSIDMREEGSYSFDADGERVITVRVESSLDVTDKGIVLPSAFGIATVSPNPFNNRARVAFDLASAGEVNLSVVDMTGRSVMTLANGAFNSGRHTVAFNGEALAGGNYLVRLESAGQVSTAKLTLVK